MKRSLLFAILSLLLAFALSKNAVAHQHVSFDSLYFYHNYSTNSGEDTVSLVFKGVGLPQFGHLTSHAIFTENDTIKINACFYAYGMAQQPYKSTDTLMVGLFNAGIYNAHVVFGVTSNPFYDTCSSIYAHDTVDLSFQVFDINAIPKVEKEIFSIYPNPASTSVTITIDETMLGSTATLTDLTGRVVSKFAILNPECAINTTGFANGIYFFTIENTTKKLLIT